MQFGTGGLTGMLCVLALLDSELKPADGPIAVSGAAAVSVESQPPCYPHLVMKCMPSPEEIPSMIA